jgi:hypothetical protein
MNEQTTLRLATVWPNVGTLKGEAGMAGEQWHWQVTISTTADPDLKRADIDVSNALAPDAVVSSLTGFIGQPQQLPVNGAVQPTTNSSPAPQGVAQPTTNNSPVPP